MEQVAAQLFGRVGPDAVEGQLAPSRRAEKEELSRLRKENKVLRMERES